MSASTEKKLRVEAREAGTDKKTKAEQEAAKQAAASKRKWTWGTVIVVVLIALIIFLNTGLLYNASTAVTIGDETYSAARVNYYYGTEFMTFYQTYGSYASYFGLDLSGGMSGLKNQSCSFTDGGTWKDYFMESAIQSMKQGQVLCKYAEENGIALTEEELSEIDTQMAELEKSVVDGGYRNLNTYFESVYGKGVTEKIAKAETARAALASKAYLAMKDSLEYTDAELEEYYQSLNGASDVFEYAYYYVEAEKVETAAEGDAATEGETGTTTSAATEETMAAAKATADAILENYNGADDEPEAAEAAEGETAEAPVEYASVKEHLDAAVKSQLADAESTLRSNANGSDLGIYSDWMMQSHEEGDATVIESENEGYYVVAYISRSDNHYNMAQVRHILVKAVADADGAYTDEAKAAAKATAEDILKEWKSGDATEDSFAALAEKYSEDTGSNTNGGLYDSIAKGQTVDEFDAFCFDEGRKAGDTGIVYGESSSYAGYHVMYYVGEGGLYSNYIAENAMLSNDLNEWLESLLEGIESTHNFGYKLVG